MSGQSLQVLSSTESDLHSDTSPAGKVIADEGIEIFVMALREEGLNTAKSHQDGEVPAAREPSVRFQGGMAALFKAFSIAEARGLPILDVRLAYYPVSNLLGFNQMGSWWEITFAAKPSYSDLSRFGA